MEHLCWHKDFCPQNTAFSHTPHNPKYPSHGDPGTTTQGGGAFRVASAMGEWERKSYFAGGNVTPEEALFRI